MPCTKKDDMHIDKEADTWTEYQTYRQMDIHTENRHTAG